MSEPPRDLKGGTSEGRSSSSFYPALVGTGNPHVLAVLGHCPAGYAIADLLQLLRNLLVGKGLGGILFLDHFLDEALEVDQGSRRSRGSLHRFREEIAQFVDTLRRVSILIGDGTADSGRVNTHLLCNLLNHHGAKVINSSVQEFSLPANNRLADLDDRLFALLDVLDELNCRGEPLFDVVAHLPRRAVLPQQAAVMVAESQLGKAVLVHDHLITVS